MKIIAASSLLAVVSMFLFFVAVGFHENENINNIFAIGVALAFIVWEINYFGLKMLEALKEK